MSEHSDKLVAQAQEKLRDAEAKVVELKRFINQVRQFDGQPALYPEESLEAKAVSGQIRSDQFYGRALATVVREILEMRKVANQGAATVAEIYSVMTEGGYDFSTSNDENAKRVLRISLTKNSVFHKLPNGRYGLSEWYPNAKDRKASNGKQASQEPEADDDEPFNTDETAEAAVDAGDRVAPTSAK